MLDAPRTRRTAAWAAGLVLAVACTAGTAGTARAADAAPPPAPSDRATTDQPTAAQLNAYWTPARMDAAIAATSPSLGPDTTAAAAPPDAAAPSDDGPQPGEVIPPSYEFDGVPQAGTFFWTTATGTGRTCSGSVVRSPHKNLVLSAGHCLKGYAGPNPVRNLAFVPGFHDGQKPYGVFPVKVGGVYVPQQYYDLGEDAGAEYDFGFAQTLPNTAGDLVEKAIGGRAFTLLTNTGYDHPYVRMIGYPGGASHTKPIYCWSHSTRWTSDDPADPGDYPRVPCADFIGGTSGGPMTVPAPGPSGFGVFGVVGGVHTGGNTASVSYSAYFGDATRALYDAAVKGAPPAGP